MSENFTSQIVAYHPANPDPLGNGCCNTGESGDGVVFLNFEPQHGSMSFIARQSLVEAAAVLFDLAPQAVKTRLGSSKKDYASQLDTLKFQLDKWKARAELAEAVLQHWKDEVDKAVGLYQLSENDE